MHAAMVPESLRKKQTRSGEWAVANKIKIGSLKKKDVGNRKRASSRFVLVDQLLYADTEDENDGLNLDLQRYQLYGSWPESQGTSQIKTNSSLISEGRFSHEGYTVCLQIVAATDPKFIRLLKFKIVARMMSECLRMLSVSFKSYKKKSEFVFKEKFDPAKVNNLLMEEDIRDTVTPSIFKRH
nr:hypothetical protein [Tanacetum cinerariifolium]